MLKHLLLSEWFRAKPFLNYIVVVTLIVPLVAASSNSSSAKQSQVAKATPKTTESDSVSTQTAVVDQPQSTQESKAAVQNSSVVGALYSVPMSVAATTKSQLLQNEFQPRTEEKDPLSNKMPDNEPSAVVELARPKIESDSMSEKVSASQHDLVQRLRAAKIQIRSVTRVDGSLSKEVVSAKSLSAAKIARSVRESQRHGATGAAVEQLNEEAAQQKDPIGSPYPIPWQWIQATQEAISSKGGKGVRYYRSVPVISPDGRYAIYSRVQLEVQREMYNSRVTSVLFVEDRQTKKLQVVTTTSPINDPLLKVKESSSSRDTSGSIGVLVPVSWSEKGDRFLARKFEGLMNTSDFRDHAVIWYPQNNRFHCVTPGKQKVEHEISLLLGWSKTQPERVLFRAGEMGQENWPLVTVANDGSTVMATEADQPVTFGQKVTELWADPPVAYR
ncbi:MAG: hypothetical protein DSM106950_19010 [Stigonema ocellatum SAG 48.90 = DSM 106950]|nr:hypothetical protein [Stigonema ocellatum SAG 48.90 = DSM 106950]